MAQGSGTGTPAAAAYAVSAGDLLDDIRVAVDDASETAWSDDELLGFLAEAVREYSQHLPRIDEVTLELVEGETRYPLPWDATAVISVEYSAGEGEATYVRRRGRRSWRSPGAYYYDVVWTGDMTRAPTLVLWFVPKAAASFK